MVRSISILGCTGSIGRQTAAVAEHTGIRVAALTANRQIDRLEEQTRKFRPEFVAVYDEAAAKQFKTAVADLDLRVGSGMEGLMEAATLESADCVVTAVSGSVGLKPTLAAIDARKRIALANKETLVCAGDMVMARAREKQAEIVPVDSEHSAIFQSLNGESHDSIEKLLLTASGGPFRNKSPEELKNMTAAEALKHPNWNMGPKVTIDSSTLVNKGLEVMEARWLFDVSYDDIEVLIHPQSIVHSAVRFKDGAVMAELGIPDMHLPIQYALFYPERRDLNMERLDLIKIRELTFFEPDLKTFRGFSLALKAARTGGTMPTVFNAANEEAVKKFLKGKISYPGITEIIEKAMDMHKVIPDPGIDEILQCEKEVREMTAASEE